MIEIIPFISIVIQRMNIGIVLNSPCTMYVPFMSKVISPNIIHMPSYLRPKSTSILSLFLLEVNSHKYCPCWTKLQDLLLASTSPKSYWVVIKHRLPTNSAEFKSMRYLVIPLSPDRYQHKSAISINQFKKIKYQDSMSNGVASTRRKPSSNWYKLMQFPTRYNTN
jgi:hypothetical protein